MSDRTGGGIRWKAVLLGWAVAVFAGILISPLLRLLFASFSGPSVERGAFTATVVVVSLVSGFLSYLAGGFVSARVARRAGGKHGALAAVFGLVVGLVLAVVLGLFGAIFAEGVALPPACFGLAGAALLAGLVLFITNLFGGFVGGTLGEPSATSGTRASPPVPRRVEDDGTET